MGLLLHLHNGTNSPLAFDGNRAFIKLDGQTVTAVSDDTIAATTCPANRAIDQAVIATEAFASIGTIPTIHDHKVQKGPVLGRYGCDEKRRLATAQRFGTRILWPGDDTQGI